MKQKACSFQVPSPPSRTFFSSLPTPWNTKRRAVVLNRVCIWGIFCPKQSQGFKHSALTYSYTQILVEYARSPEAEASTSTRKSTYLGYVYTKYRIVFAPARKPYRIRLLFTRRYLKWRATYRIDVHTIECFHSRGQHLCKFIGKKRTFA